MGKARALDAQELIQPHSERLLRSAIHLCGDESVAQDLVQETFLQALESADRFRRDSTIQTWLHGILLNLSHRRLREQGRLIFEEQLPQKEPIQPSLREALEEDYFAVKVAEAVQRLSTEHRRVIVLRYYRNLKIKQIALELGVSAGTVKSRLHYAIRCLEQFIPNRGSGRVSRTTHHRTI